LGVVRVCRMRTDMQTQIGAMLDEYRAMRSRIGGLQAAAASVTTTVRSPDRSVTVTVDAHGELRDLRIDPAIAAKLDVRELSGRILAASRLAAAQAREQVRVTMRDALPERLQDLVGADGQVDLGALLPADLSELARTFGPRS
jgi:DNA-binding protein YbaB